MAYKDFILKVLEGFYQIFNFFSNLKFYKSRDNGKVFKKAKFAFKTFFINELDFRIQFFLLFLVENN